MQCVNNRLLERINFVKNIVKKEIAYLNKTVEKMLLENNIKICCSKVHYHLLIHLYNTQYYLPETYRKT